MLFHCWLLLEGQQLFSLLCHAGVALLVLAVTTVNGLVGISGAESWEHKICEIRTGMGKERKSFSGFKMACPSPLWDYISSFVLEMALDFALLT